MHTDTQVHPLPHKTMLAPAAATHTHSPTAQLPGHVAHRRRMPASTEVAPRGVERAALTQDPTGRHTVALAGLQLLLGYEWLASGLDKVLYAHFPAELGQLLTGTLQGGTLASPFAAFLRQLVLPHSVAFGYLVEWGEILAGMGLLLGAIVALLSPVAWRRLLPVARRWLPLGQRLTGWLVAAAALGTLVMGLSFYLLDGAPTQWIMPSIALGGVLDSGLLLALGSAVLLADSATDWLRGRDRSRSRAMPGATTTRQTAAAVRV